MNKNYVFYLAGSIESLKTEQEVSDLKDLSHHIQLKAFESLEQTSWNSPEPTSAAPCQNLGFKEIEPPQKCVSDISNFVLPPKQPRYRNKIFTHKKNLLTHQNDSTKIVWCSKQYFKTLHEIDPMKHCISAIWTKRSSPKIKCFKLPTHRLS